MSDIDPEKLEADIKTLEKWVARFAGFYDVSHEMFLQTFAAARAHLANLPRFKEVERECWEIVDDDGVSHGVCRTETGARMIAGEVHGSTVVRLTGTAKVKVA